VAEAATLVESSESVDRGEVRAKLRPGRVTFLRVDSE